MTGLGVVDLRGGGIEGDADVVARRVARPFDRLHEHLHRFLVRREVGGEAALVAHRGRQAALVQQRLQRVVRLDAPTQRLGVRGGADRHDHEFL